MKRASEVWGSLNAVFDNPKYSSELLLKSDYLLIRAEREEMIRVLKLVMREELEDGGACLGCPFEYRRNHENCVKDLQCVNFLVQSILESALGKPIEEILKEDK